jgi:hypothetical protein
MCNLGPNRQIFTQYSGISSQSLRGVPIGLLHCFKEDPEYEEMLKRMWNGDLSTEDCKRINTRVI